MKELVDGFVSRILKRNTKMDKKVWSYFLKRVDLYEYLLKSGSIEEFRISVDLRGGRMLRTDWLAMLIMSCSASYIPFHKMVIEDLRNGDYFPNIVKSPSLITELMRLESLYEKNYAFETRLNTGMIDAANILNLNYIMAFAFRRHPDLRKLNSLRPYVNDRLFEILDKMADEYLVFEKTGFLLFSQT